MLFSCGSDSEDVSAVNQQTILIYMPWSGSDSYEGLYPNFLQNLDSIETAIVRRKGLGKTRALIFISETSSTSKLYEIIYEKDACKRELLKTYTGTAYTTAEGIAEILNDTRNTAQALNYALMVGCHGVGWTYFSDWNDYPYEAKSHALRVKRNRPSDNQFERTRFFGSVEDDRWATNIETLAEGIRKSGLKMQFILFDDCYMANVEVAYELRDVTNFLLASTSEVFDEGMPYTKMWSYLATPTPNYSSAVSAFKSYLDNYEAPEGSSPFSVDPTGTLAAIDCRQMDNLAAVMRQVNEHYTLDEALLLDLQVLDGFDDPIFYDMGHYVETLCTDPYLLEKFEAQLTKTVVSKTATSRLYSHIYRIPKFIEVNTFSGLTISDPSYNAVIQESKKQTAWWKATHP